VPFSEKEIAIGAALFIGYQMLVKSSAPCGGYDSNGNPVNCSRAPGGAFSGDMLLGDLMRIRDWEGDIEGGGHVPSRKADYPNYTGYLATNQINDAQHADWWAKIYAYRAQTDAAIRAAGDNPVAIIAASPSFAYERRWYKRQGWKDPGPRGWLVVNGVLVKRYDIIATSDGWSFLGDALSKVDAFAEKVWGKIIGEGEKILTKLGDVTVSEIGRQFTTAGDFLEKCLDDPERCKAAAEAAFGG